MSGQAEVIVLALNSGSSSLKFGLFRVDPSATQMLIGGEAEAIGKHAGSFRGWDAQHAELVRETLEMSSPGVAIDRIARLLTEHGLPAPDAIGHRVVHSGPTLSHHCVIDDAVLGQLEAASGFAPLHTPAALALIRLARERFPSAVPVACFDTAFHATMLELARTLPIPRALREQGIRRFGFHGLSCESIVSQLASELPRRLVIAHLGNGASVTAVQGGQSIDTSMGLTPTGGLIMGTRSGDLDPGLLVYLVREKQFDAAMLEAMVDRQSGLRGISDLASDMRQLEAAADANPQARLAITMFCRAVAKQIAGMAVALGGIDMLVFTGGIGQHAAEVRAAICADLAWCGVSVDANSSVAVRVLSCHEDRQIAQHAWGLLQRAP